MHRTHKLGFDLFNISKGIQYLKIKKTTTTTENNFLSRLITILDITLRYTRAHARTNISIGLSIDP